MHERQTLRLGKPHDVGALRGRCVACVSLPGPMSVIMYVKPDCPYCQAAREHLAAEGTAVEERDATQDDGWKAELMGHTNNRGLVPTIVDSAGKLVQVGFPPGRG